jgi:hypothetical protein
MKKLSVLLLLIMLCSPISYGQFLERFESLNETNLKGFAKPFATSYGMAMNSGAFYTADIPSFFGFSFGFRGMYILIPDAEKTFTPVLSQGYNPTEVASIFGDKGGAFIGPNGYQVTPPGINKSGMPMAVPQVTIGMFGTELLLRILPSIKFSEEHDVNLFGVGLSHRVSQYFPLLPVDIAVQGMYTSMKISNLMESKNLAFNVHASKSFVLVTPYIGLQYETSSLDIDYTYKPDRNNSALDQNLKISFDGENSVRAIIGTSLNLGFFVFNIDAGFGSLTVLTGGLTFAF